ncbi:LapA family protein [Methylibium sp.]|uniref:LapA family protein n=1 Tax=Methylibium sp. TaxID=2067992 RepID=UPI003BAB4859
MNFRALAIAVVVAALGLFALLNWPAFTAPTALNLGFAEVNAPLGLIMLVASGVLVGLFLVYIVFQQAGVIMEARRYAKELKSHRELADTAEASRFTELRAFLDGELRKMEAQGAAATRELGARLERLELQLQEKLAESTRTLSAYVGEVDDKLDRLLPPQLPR